MTTPNTLRIEKRTFCGIELDIILGHPEHDVLFYYSQVLKAAGLYNPAAQASRTATASPTSAFRIKDILEVYANSARTRDELLKPCRGAGTTWLATESLVYETLLRGHSPNTEPFRKWVTEEVLPTIRKTGSYNIHDSVTPEAQQFAQQNADVTALVGLVKVLVEQNAEMMKMLMAGREGASTVEPPKPVGEWKNARQWLDTFYLPIPPKFGMEHVGSISQALIRLANVLGLKVRKTQPCLFPRELADRALMGLTIKPADQVNQEKLTGAILEHIDGVRELEAHQRRLALEAVS